MRRNMADLKLMWVAFYFPCHDHRFAASLHDYTEFDYWLSGAGVSQSTMWRAVYMR